MFSQNAREVCEMLFNHNNLSEWYHTKELEKFEKTHNINLPNINSGDNKYKGLPDRWSLGLKRESIDIRERLEMYKKIQIPLTDMHLLGINPASTSSPIKYPILFLKTAAESFPFVDSYNFRERFGHSYRNRLDYVKCLRDYMNHGKDVNAFSKDELYKGISKFTGEDFGFDKAKIYRSKLEFFIEAIAKYIPFILFLSVLFFIYRIDSKRYGYISKFLLFGFIENSNLRRRYLQVLTVLFVLYPLFFEYYNRSYFCIVSIFENFKSTVYYPDSFPLWINGYENGLRVTWDRAILGYIVLYIVLYAIFSLVYVISKRKLKK
tara:strand:- start:2817 stop:3779 length:963 start_codon:yes stop_codon:yes gene_type:complete